MGSTENVLFDYVLVVRLTNEQGVFKSLLDYRFPPKQQSKDEKDSLADTIVQFCFPEAELWTTKASSHKKQAKSETFSFVLTESDGKKKFGYCRRFLVEDGKGNTVPECFVILSFLPSVSLFNELLNIVESLRKKSSSAVFSFLKSVLAKQFPGPGQTLSLRTFEGQTYELTRSNKNYLLDIATFEPLLLGTLSLPLLLDLFAAILTESRVIVMSHSVSSLSAGVTALSALLWPFQWQHVYIPILPQSLLTYCCAPMPFLVGVLNSSLSEMNRLPMEEGILLDLDTGKLLRPSPDTCKASNVLPPSLCAQLKTDLLKIKKSGVKGHEFNLSVSKAFLRFMNEVFGNYRGFLSNHQFQKEKFAQSKSAEIQQFLTYFNETQMYEVFLREREEMSRENKLNLCVLSKENLDLASSGTPNWDDIPLEMRSCSKCGDEVEISLGHEDIKHNNKFYCSPCHHRKQEKKDKRKEKYSKFSSSFANLKSKSHKSSTTTTSTSTTSNTTTSSSHPTTSTTTTTTITINNNESSESDEIASAEDKEHHNRRGTLNHLKEASKERMSVIFNKIKSPGKERKGGKLGLDDDLNRRTLHEPVLTSNSTTTTASYRGSTPDDFLKPKSLSAFNLDANVKKTSSLPLNENPRVLQSGGNNHHHHHHPSAQAKSLRITSPNRSVSSAAITAPPSVKALFANPHNTTTTTTTNNTLNNSSGSNVTHNSSSSFGLSSHSSAHSSGKSSLTSSKDDSVVNSSSLSHSAPATSNKRPPVPSKGLPPLPPVGMVQSAELNNNRTARQLNIKRASTVVNLVKIDEKKKV